MLYSSHVPPTTPVQTLCESRERRAAALPALLFCSLFQCALWSGWSFEPLRGDGSLVRHAFPHHVPFSPQCDFLEGREIKDKCKVMTWRTPQPMTCKWKKKVPNWAQSFPSSQMWLINDFSLLEPVSGTSTNKSTTSYSLSDLFSSATFSLSNTEKKQSSTIAPVFKNCYW